MDAIRKNLQGDCDKNVFLSHNCDENVKIDADVAINKQGLKPVIFLHLFLGRLRFLQILTLSD